MASKSNKRWTDEAEMVLMGLLYAELNPSREQVTQFNQVLTALGYDFSERSVRYESFPTTHPCPVHLVLPDFLALSTDNLRGTA